MLLHLVLNTGKCTSEILTSMFKTNHFQKNFTFPQKHTKPSLHVHMRMREIINCSSFQFWKSGREPWCWSERWRFVT